MLALPGVSIKISLTTPSPLLLGNYYAGSQNNIQLASDSNSEFAIDRVKLIGVSTNNSSQLNDTRDQAAEGQQQGAEESIPKCNLSRQSR